MLLTTISGLFSGSFKYLEVEIHAFSKICLFWVAFMFAHVKAQRIISVGSLSLGQKYGIIETQYFVSCKAAKE